MVKLWPARTKAKPTEPVADLDAIICETISFRYQGKIHTLKPVTLEDFLKFTNAHTVLMQSLTNDEKITPRELAERYQKVIGSVCGSITVDDILGMEQVQVAALFQLVIDQMTGQVKTGDGNDSKKKRQKIPLYESVQASSSPSVPESSAGQSKNH